jgi:V/A-type H+-transporting ATPase subunit E
MEELQSLLEKINREGIEKAEAEAARITAEANAKADRILKEAAEKAAKTLAEAEKNGAAFAERAAESVRQAARDTVISVQDSVTSILKKLLAENVDAALADGKTAASLAARAIEELGSGAEITASDRIVASLKAQLSAFGEIKITTDENAGTGFSVKVDGGRIEHSFSGEVIADELARRLRPDLAALLK